MSKEETYKKLLEEIESLLTHESNFIANLSNISSLIFWTLNETFNNYINWFGFYLIDKKKEKQLILGPFHGRIACTRIKFDKGVCGACISQQKVIIVPDVHKFPGHIACDSKSNSEICVPLYLNGAIVGLIDVDSVNFDAFDEIDSLYLQKVSELISKYSEE